MAERTLVWDVFDYIFEADRRRMGRIKPIRTYRIPFFPAREWAEAMEAEVKENILSGKEKATKIRLRRMLVDR